jgi:putative tryptophan/tyrosine transport system substrate-binding protein
LKLTALPLSCNPSRRAWLAHGARLGFAAALTRLHGVQAAEPIATLAVIYPDIPEPYRSVFLQIVDGVDDETKLKVRAFPVNAQVDLPDLNAQLRRLNIKAVIALGRQGLKTAAQLDRDIAVTVGGVLSLPEAEQRSLSGISLTPDPALLFARLKTLQPNVKRVWVVSDPRHNDWLMRLAKEAARSMGLELLTQEVSDLSEAVKAHEQVFAGADPKRDAVWLPQDPTAVDEQTVLPLVLRESWQRNVPVFSSSYVHVKKGVLFVLYPNNQALGRSLAATALRGAAGDGRKGLQPLREVSMAVNLRTANHLGLNISSEQQRGFDAVFP